MFHHSNTRYTTHRVLAHEARQPLSCYVVRYEVLMKVSIS